MSVLGRHAAATTLTNRITRSAQSAAPALPKKLEEHIVPQVTWHAADVNCMRRSEEELDSKAVIGRGQGDARLIQLRAGRPGPSLFIVPGLGGRIEGLIDLASLLQTPMSVFAIEARGVHDTSPPDMQIEEMARRYVSGVKTVQAAGPYFLAGHSSGGLVAFEMAQCFIGAKEKVECLILLDTGLSKKCWPFSYYLKILAAGLYGHVTTLLTIPAKEKAKYFIKNFKKLLRNLRDPYGLSHNPIDVTIAGRIAGDRYHPKFYPDKVIFFRASVKEIPADPNALWVNRVRELDIRSASGGHNSMLEWPHVSSLASTISACIAQQPKPERP